MNVYYKMKNEKMGCLTTIFLLLIGALMGGYFLFETYKEIVTMPNAMEVIQGGLNLGGVYGVLNGDKVINYISVNSGVIFQIFLLVVQLYSTRHLWRKLQQEQLQYCAKDCSYFYYGVLKYVGSLLTIFFVIDSIIILLVASNLFQYFLLSFITASLLLLVIVLMELLLTNFYQVITQLKWMMITTIIMPGIFVAFRVAQTTITINLCMMMYFAIVIVVLHRMLTKKIMQNQCAGGK